MSAAPEPTVTVVVPAWNSRRWLPGCLEALAAQSFRDFRTVVVDGGSTDGSPGLVEREYPQVEVLRLPANRGFAGGANAGIEKAASPFVALLNVDTRAEPEWLGRLVATLETAPPEVAGVGSKLLQMERPDRIDDAGDTLSWYGSAIKRGHGEAASGYDRAEEVFSVCAAAALYRAEFLAGEKFDPLYGSYFEDVDLALRGRVMGYRFLYEPRARVLHWSGGAGLGRARYVAQVTRNRLMTLAKSIPGRLLARHAGRLIWGQVYFLIAYRRPFASLRGYLGFLACLRHTLSERRRIGARRRLSAGAIDALLEDALGEPPLRRLLRRRLGRPRKPTEAGAGG